MAAEVGHMAKALEYAGVTTLTDLGDVALKNEMLLCYISGAGNARRRLD
jgi:hypothetical protein